MEEVAGRWVVDLLGLPATASTGFVTGGLMANFTASPRRGTACSRDAGWDVEAHGLPRRAARAGHRRARSATRRSTSRSATSASAARPRSSSPSTTRAACAPMRFAATLAAADRGPTIVCAQAGNVNTGAFDPIDEICDGRARARRVGARRRRVRPVGRGHRRPSRAPRRRRTRGLVGDRRAQVAQRPVRLRHRRSAATPTRTAAR